jgi:hypothetical protein
MRDRSEHYRQVCEQPSFASSAEPMANAAREAWSPQIASDSSSAHKLLDAMLPADMNHQDRQTLRNLHGSMVLGDWEGVCKSIARFNDDPNGLRSMIQRLDQNLAAAGSTVRAVANSAGEVTIYGAGPQAVRFSTNGSSHVREMLQHRPGVYEIGERLPQQSPDGTMKNLGKAARESILNEQRWGWMRWFGLGAR